MTFSWQQGHALGGQIRHPEIRAEAEAPAGLPVAALLAEAEVD